MAAGSTAARDRTLEETPTWALAVVCAVFVIISVLIEHGIHSVGKWFQKRRKKAMSEALEKIKAELMLLGFISLLLTVSTRFIAKICIPAELEDTMLPCKPYDQYKKDDTDDDDKGGGNYDRRKLLSYAENVVWRRVLAGGPAGDDYCSKYDKVPLISPSGVHQLHIFIFVLAVFHVLYSVITMALAQAKTNKWKAWESETSSLEYQCTNDPTRFRFTHQTSFVKRHSGFSTTTGIRWIVAFLRQFFGSVSKVDYATIRRGFINAHFAPNSKFNFHKYIKRSMEDDFKMVVGISLPLWLSAVIFLLLNVYKWYSLTWLSLAPLVILLLVGTKLELIIIEMAQEIQDRATVVEGAPVVEPNNKYFWFNSPRWILFLIHFTIFESAFQLAYFLYEFGMTSCFRGNLPAALTKVSLGIALLILCSYITFPLYALVIHMGSHMKKAIFEEQTAKALKKWHKDAKDRNKLRKASGVDTSCSGLMGGENTPSQGTSPRHLLHNYKYKSSKLELEAGVLSSPRSHQDDTDLSEIDQIGSPDHQSIGHDHHDQPPRDENFHSIDFSFSKA
ncbi:MLO protein homolog 1-like [Juglans microcarpa x Juglans regia]|uniref:MLO protein homolog 1-like n=1 Tax=Juglans microcarpa x Juglans regia TaxID=2249226 RepID=UPI001B7E90E0|nr:MLO protein homolog 1-like [Juglans microcarpa x Juglans regia]